MSRSPDPGRAQPGTRDRIAAAFLLVVMVIGSFTLWIGVPATCSWIAAQLTADQTTHLQITVPLTIAAMVVFAWLLFRVNRAYVGIAAPPDRDELDDEEEGEIRYVRGPLEPILVGSLLIALVALTVWFFLFAENPPEGVF